MMVIQSAVLEFFKNQNQTKKTPKPSPQQNKQIIPFCIKE